MPIKQLLVLLMLSLGVWSAAAQTEPIADIRDLTFDTSEEATLNGAEVHTWTFEGDIEQMVIISAERYPPQPDTFMDPALALYAPDGTLLLEDDNGSVGRDAILLHVSLPQTGTYTVTVTNVDQWNAGDYRITLAQSTLPPRCQTPFGEMINAEMPSEIVGFPVIYRVFLPPCHEVMQKRYPYVILMHGSSSGDGHWDLIGVDEAIVRGVSLNYLPPMAVVLPFGGELANLNIFRQDYSWEYVVTRELVPHMEDTYCLQTEREGRAIGGISRGGFWAFEIAFRNPDMFSILGGHSPFFDWYHAPETHNPLYLTQGEHPDPPLRIWIDRGEDDYAQLNIDAQHENMTNNELEHTFMLYPVGEHENSYWQAYTDTYLQFYSEDWSYDVETLPDCK